MCWGNTGLGYLRILRKGFLKHKIYRGTPQCYTKLTYIYIISLKEVIHQACDEKFSGLETDILLSHSKILWEFICCRLVTESNGKTHGSDQPKWGCTH